MDDVPPFAELHCRSNFTFLVGASQPEELAKRAAAKLYTALALTDECSVAGVVRSHLEARECGILVQANRVQNKQIEFKKLPSTLQGIEK